MYKGCLFRLQGYSPYYGFTGLNKLPDTIDQKFQKIFAGIYVFHGIPVTNDAIMEMCVMYLSV